MVFYGAMAIAMAIAADGGGCGGDAGTSAGADPHLRYCLLLKHNKT
jgi:hypothetical protein